MASLFLILSFVSAGLTLNVYRPLSAGPRVAFASFMLGWLWGELALHAVVAQLAIAALFAAGGALATGAGQLALVITAGSCGALAYQYLEYGGAAGDVAQRALEDGLGRGYETVIAPELASRLESGVEWAQLVRPFHMRDPEVECVRDIPFDRQRGINLRLDLYRHRSMPLGCPVLLQIHGGGWMIGDKREQGIPLVNRLATSGWVCINANYRLSPHATFPEHLIDCKRALAWIREHAGKYGADPDFVVVTGGSAGGHLAALMGLTANDPRYQPGFEEIDTTVSAVVPFYGVYDWTNRFGLAPNDGLEHVLERNVIKGAIGEVPERYSEGSPMDRIHPGAPPFMIIHGTHDSLVVAEEARRFAELLRKDGDAAVVYAEIPGAQHAFDLFKSLRERFVSAAVHRFLAHAYSSYRDERSGRESSAEAGRAKTARAVEATSTRTEVDCPVEPATGAKAASA